MARIIGPLSRLTVLIWLIATAFILCSVATGWPAENLTSDGNLLLRACTPLVRYLDGEQLYGEALTWALGCAKFLPGLHKQALASWITANCLPHNVSPQQGIRLTVKWLREHPEILHHDMQLLYSAALAKDFCR